ncbi:MAG: hypothetical protein Kow0075_00060 [Salibacteraceae bacterium]
MSGVLMKLDFHKVVLTALVIAGGTVAAFASHNRAGEIIFKRVDDNPFRYEISIITYTKTGNPTSDQADRCELTLNFGYNNVSETVYRVNGPSSSNCEHTGEPVGVNIKKNIYTTRHTFPGSGVYKVWVQDQNRNAGVINIDNSDQVAFYVESEIVIDVSSGGNNAPILQYPPIDNGCVGQPFVHNPGAVDPDGDSLVYSLVVCKSGYNQTIGTYQFPDEIEPGDDNVLTLDPRTGTLIWDSPQRQGEYNIAIKIEEYRYNKESGEVIFVGSILRDMQIDIGLCEPRNPPVISTLGRLCAEAGSTVQAQAIATDQDFNSIELSATGYPLTLDGTAYLSPSDVVVGQPPLTLDFTWNTNCSHVQYEPYWIYFKAKEDLSSSIELVDFEEIEIHIVAPRVSITDLDPVGASLHLSWTAQACEGADGYDIYRSVDSTGFVGTDCNVGIPDGIGYVKIGRVDGASNTTFIDDNQGEGLVHGQRYCYMVVTTFPDKSLSYASYEACGELVRDVPILNKVSVVVTDSASGADSIAWYKPTDLDVAKSPPPYAYRLSRAAGDGEPVEIYRTPQSASIDDLDTVFYDTGLNTLDNQHRYTIELLSGNEQVANGKSRSASSVYLTSTPSDNTLTLTWDADVPWTNLRYVVYRFNKNLATFVALDTVTETSYADRGLRNETPYTYKVLAIGEYSSVDFDDVLYNWSQEHTGVPRDLEPPCSPPEPFVEGDCNLDLTTISWHNPNNVCDSVDDVVKYRIYYSAVLGEPLELLEEIEDVNDTVYERQTNASIAGCYAVTAVDSFGNESAFGNSLCIDNCPIYELPNIFTPGYDGNNDYFRPFPYKYVESIDLHIFNRWGVEVFSTTDPDIMWDGRDQRNGEWLPDGTYFYHCVVNEIRLIGIVPREIRGNITIIGEGAGGQTPK